MEKLNCSVCKNDLQTNEYMFIRNTDFYITCQKNKCKRIAKIYTFFYLIQMKIIKHPIDRIIILLYVYVIINLITGIRVCLMVGENTLGWSWFNTFVFAPTFIPVVAIMYLLHRKND